jgi:hypothetical protein
MLRDLPAGIYRHYKGHYYQCLGYGHDANYEDRITVNYIGLQLQDAHTGPRMATRTAESDDPEVDAWFDYVHADGKKCCCAHQQTFCPGNQLRFKYIGPGWNP